MSVRLRQVWHGSPTVVGRGLVKERKPHRKFGKLATLDVWADVRIFMDSPTFCASRTQLLCSSVRRPADTLAI